MVANEAKPEVLATILMTIFPWEIEEIEDYVFAFGNYFFLC